MQSSPQRRQNSLPRTCLYAASATTLAMTLVLATGIAAYADEPEPEVIVATPGTSYSRSATTGWNTTTGNDDAVEKMPRPKSSLTIRAYEGFGTLSPYYGDELIYGVDITSEIEKCPNGTDRISALNIGGWFYEVDGDCSDYQRHTRVSASGEEQAKNGAEESGEAVLSCDPVTWRCRTINRP